MEHHTLQKLSSYFKKEYGDRLPKNRLIENKNLEAKKEVKTKEHEPIAVIGVACNFPGAKNIEEFWQNLKLGKSSITEVPSSRWRKDRFYCTEYKPGKSISKWGGFIDDIEYFDAEYFNIKEDDALYVDPLLRQFLEISVQTVRSAGYEKEELWNKRIGVFVGSRTSNYANKIGQYNKNSIVGIGQNFIATRTSHFFNFTGPSMVVDTACSSSLVALHQACQSLALGECELALAGGVDIILDEKPYIILSESRALSPDCTCYPFDKRANGMVLGEGCGAVLLKPLYKAVEDGDIIYGIIESSSVNNDGNTMGVTTPNPRAQQELIEIALKKADIDSSTISYVEAHGTGTMIGDPIELRALTTVFRQNTQDIQFCAVGSVKSNIGHLASAAGIAGFIKVLLSLNHKQLVPTLHCETPNPRFDFDSSPFYPNAKLKVWEPRYGTRRAAISSFGLGGTNAHLIVREADSQASNKKVALPPIIFNRKRYWPQTTVLSNTYFPGQQTMQKNNYSFTSFFNGEKVEAE